MPQRHRTESATSPRRLVAVDRQRQALALRIQGMTLQQIADAVGYKSRQAAHVALTAAIRKSMRPPEVTHERYVDLERLDVALFHVLRELVGGELNPFTGLETVPDTDAVPKLVQLLRRRADMLGLDAPVKQELTGRDGGPIELAVLTLAQRLQRIIDAEPTPVLPSGVQNGPQPD